MAVPPSDKIPAAKMYRLQYIKQSNSSTMPTHLYDWAVSSNKKYLNYIYFQGQNNGSWYTPVEISATEDTLEFYVGRAGTAAASDFYIYVNGTQYTVGKWGYQVKCIFAAYSSIGSTANNLVASTIAPLYDPAYADTTVSPIVINKLTQSQYESITPDGTQLYLITDANLETTNHKVQSIDENSTNTQYPSATAVNDVKYRGEPFWIQPTANAYIMFSITGDASTIGTKPISYSFDKISWTDSTVGSLANGTTSINVSSNQKVYFKSTSTAAFHTNYVNIARLKVKTTSSSSSTDVNFVVGGKLISLFNDQAGNATYLLSESSVIDASELDVNNENTACVCDSLFEACANLTTPPVLSATILPNYAYANMFNNCTSLNNAPALPAEELTSYCYTCMFAGCTNLRYAPPIMAKILANNCCEDMFLGCTSLETAPELLATTLAIDCYYEMFYNCSSLKQIPRLYSTTLAEECYYRMFGGCSSLELQSTSDGTHYNIVKVPEKPKFDWTLAWNNSMMMAPNGTVTLPDVLDTYQTEAYKLPATRTFNGSSDYIDTGLRLLDTDKDFTVMVDFAYGTSPGQYNTVLQCMIETSPYNRGLCIYYYTTTPAIIPIYYQAAPSYTADQNRHKVIFRHNAGDAAVATLFYDSSTGVDLNGSSYTAVNKNVYLGCRLTDSNSRDRYFKGTLYDARIYFESLSDTNIADLINGDEPTDPITPYYNIRGNTLTGLVFSSNSISYDSIQIDSSGNMHYGTAGTYTKVYDISTGWVNASYKTLSISNNSADFEDKFTNDWLSFKNRNLTIIYSWDSRGLSITGMNFKSNNTNYNSLAVNDSGDTISYDFTTVYNSNGWTNSNYKTLTSSYNLGQHFTGTNWSGFFETNKNTNTSTTITVPSNALSNMFANTGGTWKGTPTLNKAYFTNAVLIPEANMSQTDAGYVEIWWKDALVTSEQSLLYSLLTTTTFNGTSDYIDTNVKVLNGDPAFSIFVDFQQAALVSDMREVIHCNTEVSPYPGLSLDINPPSYTRLAYYNKVNNYTRDTNRHKAIITHTAGAQNVCTWYYDNTTAVPTTGTTAYSNVDRNLLIGCYQDASGNKGRFLNGTIYSCVVLDRIFTSAEISSLMSGTIPSTFDWSVKNQTLSVRFMCNGILYNKLKIDSDGSMYYGQDNVYTIVYNVSTNTWDEWAKRIQVISPISSTFINEWDAFLSQSKI